MNEKFGKISQTEKEDIVAKVKNSRIKDTVREMVRARAQWINLHFDADPGEPQEKRTERYAYANRLTFFQQDEMDKLRQVYDTGQAYFDYETAKLQKTMLEGRLHEFFNATNPQEREHLSLQLSATLNFPSHNLLSIRMKGGSVEDQVAEAMQFNKQDSQLEYLKGLIDPSLIENNSDNV